MGTGRWSWGGPGNRHVGDFGVGQVDGGPVAFRVHADLHRSANVRPTRTTRRGKTDDVADPHRAMELDALHPHRDQRLVRPIPAADFVMSADGAGQVDVAEDHPAENGPVRIGVARQHHGLEGQVPIALLPLSMRPGSCLVSGISFAPRHFCGSRQKRQAEERSPRASREARLFKKPGFCASWQIPASPSSLIPDPSSCPNLGSSPFPPHGLQQSHTGIMFLQLKGAASCLNRNRR